MRVMNISTSDTGGCGWLTQLAFAGTDVTYDVVSNKSTWIGYPTVEPWSERHRLAELADVHHARQKLSVLDGLPRRPRVIHHHGTRYRSDPHTANREAARYGARTIVSTVDLLEHAPADAVWHGIPHDLDWLAKFRRPLGGSLRVGHAPTIRSNKGTDDFLAAAKRVPGVKVVLIEWTPWMQALGVKGTCDVLFDQFTLGYGSNAVEAWGMGLPVISGAAPHILDRMRAMWGELPFMEATPRTIGAAVEAMKDPAVRDEWAARGHAHVTAYHTREVARAKLGRLYEEVLAAG